MSARTHCIAEHECSAGKSTHNFGFASAVWQVNWEWESKVTVWIWGWVSPENQQTMDRLRTDSRIDWLWDLGFPETLPDPQMNSQKQAMDKQDRGVGMGLLLGSIGAKDVKV